jgi:hypothetical protein
MADTQVLVRHPVTGQLHPVTVSADARISELLPLALAALELPVEVAGQPVDYWLEDDRESVRLMPNVRVRLVGSEGHRVVRLASNAPVAAAAPVFEEPAPPPERLPIEPPAGGPTDTLQAAVDAMLREEPGAPAAAAPEPEAGSFVFEPSAEAAEEAAAAPGYVSEPTILAGAREEPAPEATVLASLPSDVAGVERPAAEPDLPVSAVAPADEAPAEAAEPATPPAADAADEDNWVSDRSGSGASLPQPSAPERPAAERPAPPPRRVEGPPSAPPTSTVIMHIPAAQPGRPRPVSSPGPTPEPPAAVPPAAARYEPPEPPRREAPPEAPPERPAAVQAPPAQPQSPLYEPTNPQGTPVSPPEPPRFEPQATQAAPPAPPRFERRRSRRDSSRLPLQPK